VAAGSASGDHPVLIPQPHGGALLPGGGGRNPTGINGYTYRRKFEDAIEKALTTAEADGRCGAEVLAEKVLELARAGEEAMVREVLARAWPKVDKHEVSGADGGPIIFAWESAVEGGESREGGKIGTSQDES
jgi:hypothetical protein